MLFTLPLLLPSVARLQGGERWAPTLPPTHTHVAPFRDQVSALRILLPSHRVCAFHQALASLSLSLVLRTVQASLGCSMVVTPWFLPSLKRWQWSTLKMAVVYSASWTFTFFSQVPKHPVLLDDQCQFISILQTLNALRSLLMMVLALGLCLDGSLLQMPVSLKAVSRRKMPGNQLFFFSCRASLCLHPHPNSFTVLSLGFIFESTC